MGQRVPDLTVCIVNWNTREELRGCLESIYDTAVDLDVEVIVVDNASSDGSAEMVASSCPEAILLRNQDNRGFARATNQALRHGHGPYYLLLNPDIVVCPGALQAMLSFMKATRDAGAASGKLVLPDGSFQTYYYRRDHGLVLWLLETANRLTWNVAPGWMDRLTYTRFDPSRVSELQMLPGGCMMVRADVLSQVGLLDEDFFLLHEDDEWCRRIRDAGWKLYFVPSAQFVHEGGVSFEDWGSAIRASQSLASRLLFLEKHYSTCAMVTVRAVLAANFVLHLGAVVIGRQLGLARAQRRIGVQDRLQWIRAVLQPPRSKG